MGPRPISGKSTVGEILFHLPRIDSMRVRKMCLGFNVETKTGQERMIRKSLSLTMLVKVKKCGAL